MSDGAPQMDDDSGAAGCPGLAGAGVPDTIDVQLRGIFERDIDLLLLEEIVATAGFREWFLAQLGYGPVNRLVRAARSVNTSTGESDLELTLRDRGQVTRVLIENKIDAPLQPHQAGRYKDRAASYVSSGDCDAAVTVLVAPACYVAGVTGFDHILTYETIDAFLSTQPGAEERTSDSV